MPRIEKSGPEIQAEVSRLIHMSETVMEDNATVRVPLPLRLVQLDPSGCNWTMETFGGDASGHLDVIGRAMNAAKAKWNLAP